MIQKSKYKHFWGFHSELKRRLKAEQKAKEKAEKAAAVPEKPVKEAKKEVTKVDEEISPNEYFKLRTAAVTALKNSNDPDQHPYPHKFHVSIGLTEFIEKYKDLQV